MKVRSNNPQVEAALQAIADAAVGADRRSRRDIHVGPGMRTLHSSEDTLLLEATRRSGGGGGGCRRWTPQRVSGNGGAVGLKWRDGAINGVLAKNIHKPVQFNPETELLYILAEVTASSGNLTEFTIIIDKENRASMEDTEEVPPSTFYVLLGTINRGAPFMTVCTNLDATPVETRRSGVEPSAPGMEPFTRWYRWSVQECNCA